MNILEAAVLNVSTNETGEPKIESDSGEAFAFLMQTPQHEETLVPETPNETVAIPRPESSVPDPVLNNIPVELEFNFSLPDVQPEQVVLATRLEIPGTPIERIEISGLAVSDPPVERNGFFPEQSKIASSGKLGEPRLATIIPEPNLELALTKQKVTEAAITAPAAAVEDNPKTPVDNLISPTMPGQVLQPGKTPAITTELPTSLVLPAQKPELETVSRSNTSAESQNSTAEIVTPAAALRRFENPGSLSMRQETTPPNLPETAGGSQGITIGKVSPEPTSKRRQTVNYDQSAWLQAAHVPAKTAVANSKRTPSTQPKFELPPRANAATFALSVAKPPAKAGLTDPTDLKVPPVAPQETVVSSARSLPTLPQAVSDRTILFDTNAIVALETVELDKSPYGAALPIDAENSLRALGTNSQFSLEPRQQIPVRVVQMIAEAARNLPGQPVQLALSPEELGSVRLTLHTVDSAMNISVAVERPETLELLRRNIELLASELRDLGYSNLTFEFAQGEQQHDEDENAKRQIGGSENSAQLAESETPVTASSIVLDDGTARIDIRL